VLLRKGKIHGKASIAMLCYSFTSCVLLGHLHSWHKHSTRTSLQCLLKIWKSHCNIMP